jgi:beta-glucosidase
MDYKKQLASLTLEEKIGLLSGKDVWNTLDIPRLNINSLRMADGPFGIRRQLDDFDSSGKKGSLPSTCFPAPSLLANSFNRDLMFEIGQAMAKEAIKNNVNILLAPGINIKRNPLAGRNFEYFSEDPYLTGEMALKMVEGLASLKVGAAVKHFALNQQETFRFTNRSIVDEVALHDLYLKAFKKVISQMQPAMVMSSYNKSLNGYIQEDPYFLTTLLRDEWKYQGIVISDWGATDNRVNSLNAGLDIEMPSSSGVNDRAIYNAVKAKALAVELIDKSVIRILQQVEKLKPTEVLFKNESHHELAYKAALESFVLLKNEDQVLPIKIDDDIAIIGELAKNNRIQGGGSSRVNPTYISNIFNRFRKENQNIKYAQGYSIDDQKINQSLVTEASNLAASVTKVILFVGLTDYDENEGIDRKHLRLSDNQLHLIDAITQVNKNIVIVLTGGSVVELPFLNKIKGLILVSLMGQGGARALMDILLGLISPSGKLAETYPIKIEDVLGHDYFPGGNNATYYVESIFVGYRNFNTFDIPVNFPFGFGLSYNTYKISKINFDVKNLKIAFTIKNNGKYRGAEIIQFYHKELERSFKNVPQKLVGFIKVYLNPGEQKEVEYKLDLTELKSFDLNSKKYEIIGNSHLIQVATSSREIIEELTFSYKGIKENSRFNLGKESLNLAGLKKNLKLEHLPPINIEHKRGNFTLNTPLVYLKNTLVGKFIYQAAVKSITDNAGKNIFNDQAMIEGLEFTPLRMMAIMSGGDLSLATADKMIALMNRDYKKFLRLMLNKTIKDPNGKDQ